MKTLHKIYGALAILVVLGVVLYMKRSSATAEKDSHAPGKSERPSFTLNPEDIPNVTKLEFVNAEKKETIVLEKQGANWNITAPIKAKANGKEVDDLLKSLGKLKVTDQIDSGTGAYGEYDLADGSGIHFTAYKGNDKAIDVVFGKSGGRGQTVRVMGRDGVWTVAKDEYKSVLFSKESKNWRDKLVLEMKDTDIASVDLVNPEGHYVFTRDGDNWKGSFDKNPNAPKKDADKDKKDDADKKDDDASKSDDDKDKKEGADKKDDKSPEKDKGKKEGADKSADKGKKDGDKGDKKKADGDKKDAPKETAKKDGDKKDAGKKDEAKKDDDKKDEAKKDEPKEAPKNPGWEKFDGKNVETLISAFKKLNAHDFADASDTVASTGLDAPQKEGGVLTFKMKDGKEVKLLIGKKQKGSARFAKKADDDTIFVVAQSQADWVTAEPSKFEKKDSSKKDDKKGKDGPPPEPEPEPEDMDMPPMPEE